MRANRKTVHKERGGSFSTSLITLSFSLFIAIGTVFFSRTQSVTAGYGVPGSGLGEGTEEANFENSAFTEPYSMPSSSSFAATKIPKRKRDEIVSYTVQGGDTVSGIASVFEIPTSAIVWSNGLSGANPVIKPGQTLKIVQGEGLIHKIKSGETIESIAKIYGADPARITPENPKVIFSEGSEIFIPGGKPPAPKPVPPKPTTQFYNPPVTNPNVSQGSGNFFWPTTGRISQYYGKTPFSYNYANGIHTGVDIANSVGTPIYATTSGTVTSAKWDSGYGLAVRINHGGGLTGIYGHMSKLAVSYGQWVEKGQLIGYMGSTGWSTGSHLHFEFRQNGVTVNPLNFAYD